MSVKPIFGLATALLKLNNRNNNNNNNNRTSQALDNDESEQQYNQQAPHLKLQENTTNETHSNIFDPTTPGSSSGVYLGDMSEEVFEKGGNLTRQLSRRPSVMSPVQHYPDRIHFDEYIDRGRSPGLGSRSLGTEGRGGAGVENSSRPPSVVSYTNTMSAYGDDDVAAGIGGRAYMESPSGRLLEEGALVIMLTRENDLVFTQQTGKIWELQATQTRHPNGVQSAKLRFYPYGCLFTVLRKGKYVGFRALGAEGRTVQAVSEEDCPHRVNNHNFGPWEMWELTPEGYINKRFQHKMLGYEVREIAAVSMEDIQNLEDQSSQAVRRAVSQWKISERKSKELGIKMKRISAQHQNDLNEIRNRLQDNMRDKQRLEVESVRTGARLKQLELHNQQLNLHIEAAESAQRKAESECREIKSSKQLLQEKLNENSRKLERFETSGDVEKSNSHDTYKSSNQEKEILDLRKELETTRHQRDSESHKLRQKANDYNQLMSEHRRLQSAFQSVKAQVEQLNVVKAQIDAFHHRMNMEEGLQRSGSPMLNSRTIHSMPVSSSPHTRSGMHSGRLDSFRSEGGLRLSASAAQLDKMDKMATAAVHVNDNGSTTTSSSIMGDQEGIIEPSSPMLIPRPNLQRNSLPLFSVDTPVPYEADITRTRQYCSSISTGSTTSMNPTSHNIIINNDVEKTEMTSYKHEKNSSMGGFVDLQCHENEMSRSNDMDRQMSIENEVSY